MGLDSESLLATNNMINRVENRNILLRRYMRLFRIPSDLKLMQLNLRLHLKMTLFNRASKT